MRNLWNGLTPGTRRTVIRCVAIVAAVTVICAAVTGVLGELLQAVIKCL